MVYIYNGILLIIKKIMICSLTYIILKKSKRMALEGIMLSEMKSDRERQILCIIICMLNLKNKTNE